MRNFIRNSLRISLFISVVLTFLGITILVYAGPCYIQTSVKSASEKGCHETFIGPDGQTCPSKKYASTNGIPTDCGYKIRENNFGIGTSGNEESGRMEQGSVTRSCYTYVSCKLIGPCFDAFPLAEGMYYVCEIETESSTSATASSFEPTGADCVFP
ncbi:MAG: hypothetical protein LBQ50_05280 [Planctomycetaceae bacterium]|jgi:hypothetical protein|nr:hypothetical protein [Planctomycetaceae bacterium]